MLRRDLRMGKLAKKCQANEATLFRRKASQRILQRVALFLP